MRPERKKRRPNGAGLSATERVQIFRASLRGSGGSPVTFHLGAAAVKALQALAAPGEGNDLIERLLLEEVARRRARRLTPAETAPLPAPGDNEPPQRA